MVELTGSVSTMGGGSDAENPNSDGKNTPQSFDVAKDARSCQESGQYPNYWSHKTRSGHNFIMDDSEGCETVTLQHRSGSSLQFRPDGGVLMTTHNGKYEVVFGESRVTISGAHDITVKGDASMRIYGNNNMTVHGDHNLTVMGDHNITAKNVNYSVRGNIDTEAKNINTRVEGSGTYNYLGALSTVSKGNMTTLSFANRYDGAGKDHHTKAKSNKTTDVGKKETHKVGEKHELKIEASVAYQSGRYARRFGAGNGQAVYQQTIDKNGVKINNTKDLKHKVGGKTEYQYGDGVKNKVEGKLETDVTQNIETKSQEFIVQAATNLKATAGSILNMQAPSGTATFAGGVTNVNALSGVLNMAAGAAGINLDALGGLLNLNGGIIGALQQALNLQLSFDFGDITSNIQMPDITGGQADQPQEEPDLTSETSSWL